MLIHRLATLTGLAVATLFLAAPANALTIAECSTKYNAAKDAGTLNGQTWNQFRKAECGTKPAKKTAKASDAAKSDSKAAAADDDNAAKGLTAKECSTKYQAAKAAGTLNGMKWNDFRKAECGAAADDDDTVPAPTEATYTSEPEKPSVAAPKGVKFPTAISKKFASETPAKGRMHTCLELYYANKDANTLNGLKWIQKGGGFYSLCNAKLKS
ncbi:MAG: antifreeze protein [Mesorhizobium sp.]|nr:MAG: antifreeze protein [Mesorhizobium sp.]